MSRGALLYVIPANDTPNVIWPSAGRMHALRITAERLARGDIGVLLVGESGVGKEVVAELIHRASPRAHKPLIRIDCGAPDLDARIEAADGATILLDEVADLSADGQGRLLRVIGKRDIRAIAMTRHDLHAGVASGTFRGDLFHRLNAARLEVPALRERRDEIVSLATAFVARATRDLGRAAAPQLLTETCNALVEYDWPGNVRELRHAMEFAALLCDDIVEPSHLPPAVLSAPGDARKLRDDLDNVERNRIIEALARSAGSQSGAARVLGISRTTLLSRLDRYGIARPRKSAR